MEAELESDFQSESDAQTGDSGGIADVSSIGNVSDISIMTLDTLPICDCGLKTKIDVTTNKERFYVIEEYGSTDSVLLSTIKPVYSKPIKINSLKSCICAAALGSRCDFVAPLKETISKFPD